MYAEPQPVYGGPFNAVSVLDDTLRGRNMVYRALCVVQRRSCQESCHARPAVSGHEGEFMELYLHIPFCVRKCEYCSFVSFSASENDKRKYVSTIVREAEMRCHEANEPVETVFIGGGTPSLLAPEQFSDLVRGIRNFFPFRDPVEFSVEANPGTVSERFLRAAVSAGVNRISLGMQAYQTPILQFLGRIHTFEDVKRSVGLIRSSGIRNINLDLIFGIPGQTLSEWKETLDAAISLSPDHISAYGLIPEEGTPLFRRLESKDAELPDPELERQMYDLAIRILRTAGLEQYEISNFARKGFECRHNIGYWNQAQYIGLGLSASSMLILNHHSDGLTCLRKTNPSDPVVYEEMIRSGDFSAVDRETVLPAEARFETMMLSLRMNRGISESRFLELHGVTIESCYGDKLEQLLREGLLRHDNGTWSLTRRGMDIQNSILVELMEEP